MSTSILSADDGEKKAKTSQKSKKELAGWTERKGLAELHANVKPMGCLVRFLKSTEVGGREGAKEWEGRNDPAGGELLGD